jgi:D-alanine---D-serine ligase
LKISLSHSATIEAADQISFFFAETRQIRLKGAKMNKKNKKTIAVVFGGCSTEYEVSLKSACSVIEHLDLEKYQIILLGITRHGEWLKYDGEINEILNDTWSSHKSCVPAVISPDRTTRGLLVMNGGIPEKLPVDVVFPVLHGKNGEDGTMQGLLELAGIPFAGCGTLSSALCMDKDIAHRLAALEGIKITCTAILNLPSYHYDTDPNSEFDEILKAETTGMRYPLFVKPANAGSSFGITKVEVAEDLETAVRAAAYHDSKILVEEAVTGFEVGCAVLGNEVLTIGDLDEIELTGGFFNFKEKYTLETSKIHLPARIDEDTTRRIKESAAVVYKALGCRGFARVDFFLTPDREIYFNEVNTIPGFTDHSRYPSMLKNIGISFGQLLDELIRLAVKG